MREVEEKDALLDCGPVMDEATRQGFLAGSDVSEDTSRIARRSSSARVPLAASIALAVLLGGAIFATGESQDPWLRAATSLFVLVMVQQDLLRNRIPNLLTFPALALAIGLAFALGGAPGALDALVGSGLVFLTLFVPFALRALGAGDVKALMVLGALAGNDGVWGLLLWTTLLSGLVAVAVLVARGGAGELVRRWRVSLGATLALREATYIRPPSGAVAATGHPKGVAIALGVLAMQLWGVPWANG